MTQSTQEWASFINLVRDGISSAQYAAQLGVGTPNTWWTDERSMYIHSHTQMQNSWKIAISNM